MNLQKFLSLLDAKGYELRVTTSSIGRSFWAWDEANNQCVQLDNVLTEDKPDWGSMWSDFQKVTED